MKPYDFRFTNFYENNSDFSYTGLQLSLSDKELIICSTVIDKDNYSILTTRRLLTQQDGELKSGTIQGSVDKFYGDFKGYKQDNITFGLIQLESGEELKYFIETGKASMIMIYGVRTLIQTNGMNRTQVEKVSRIWNVKE